MGCKSSTEKHGDALINAAAEGDATLVQQILEVGDVDVNYVGQSAQVLTGSSKRQPTSALNEAVGGGHMAVVKLLLVSAGASMVSPPCDEGSIPPPLHVAAFNGHVLVLKLLVEQFGADLNMVVHEGALLGMTALHMAACNNQTDAIDMLIKLGAAVDPDKATCSGMPPFVTSDDGSGFIVYTACTPLFLATKAGHRSGVAALIRGGASISRYCTGNYVSGRSSRTSALDFAAGTYVPNLGPRGGELLPLFGHEGQERLNSLLTSSVTERAKCNDMTDEIEHLLKLGAVPTDSAISQAEKRGKPCVLRALLCARGGTVDEGLVDQAQKTQCQESAWRWERERREQARFQMERQQRREEDARHSAYKDRLWEMRHGKS